MFLLGVSILINTCKKESEMSISTGEISDKTAYSITITGKVNNIGKGAVQYGHMYSRSPNETVTLGSELPTKFGVPGNGIEFPSQFVTLFPGEKYYVKAYITDGTNTVYGKEISFTTNDCPDTPEYTGSSVENNTPATLEIIFKKELADISPPASAFIVREGYVDGNIIMWYYKGVTKAMVSGNKVILTLLESIHSGTRVTFTYQLNDTNSIQSSTGCRAPYLNNMSVINRVNP